jgi:hypothetical protein
MTALLLPTKCIARFEDGLEMLAFDAEQDDSCNETLAKNLSAEGKRRLRAGQSDAATIRSGELLENTRTAG